MPRLNKSLDLHKRKEDVVELPPLPKRYVFA